MSAHELASTRLTPDVYVWCKCGAQFDAYGNKGAMNKLQDHILEELTRPAAPNERQSMINQVIPEAAVEAAARVNFTAEFYVGWDGLNGSAKSSWLRTARAALEAAAPHMLAGAWDEGREGGMSDAFAADKGFTGYHANPYRPTP